MKGHNATKKHLSDQQWIEFGATMKKFHSAHIPKAITRNIQRETFSSKWRKTVKVFLERIKNEIFEDPIATEMALFLKSKSNEILELIGHAERLVRLLQNPPLKYVLCHADIHGWNLLIDEEDALYIVDWDTLLFAPKERDLMFIGAGIWDSGRTLFEEDYCFMKDMVGRR